MRAMPGNQQEQFICTGRMRNVQPTTGTSTTILLAEVAPTEQSVQMIALVEPVDPFRR